MTMGYVVRVMTMGGYRAVMGGVMTDGAGDDG